MAAQTIKAQVEELVGSTSIASLDDWCGDATDKLILLLPYEVLFPFASVETVTYTGSYTELTAKNKRIFEVLRAPAAGSVLNRVCSQISPGEYKGQFADPNSLYYPTDYDPKYTIYGDVVKVLPAVSGMVVTSKYIALTGTVDSTAIVISTLPYECEYLVVLDVAQRVGYNKIQALALAVLTDSLVIPVAPNTPSFIYTDATKNTAIATLLGSLGVVPVYTKPSIGSFPSDLSIADLTLSAVAPTSPTLATVSYSNASASTVSAVTFGNIPSVPAYIPVAVPAGLATAFTAFDTAMTNEDIELAGAQIQKANQYLTQFDTLVRENLQQFNKDMEKFKADVEKLVIQSQLTEQEAQTNAKLATDVALQNAIQTMQAIAMNNTSLIQKYQYDAALYAQKVNAEVSVYSANVQKSIQVYQSMVRKVIDVYQNDIQNELNETNIQIADYQVTLQAVSKQLEATLQEALTNAKISADVEVKNREMQLAKQVQEYQATLKLYEDKISAYAQQLQAEIGVYQGNLMRINNERDRLLTLVTAFKNDYYEALSTKFGINLRGKNDGKQG